MEDAPETAHGVSGPPHGFFFSRKSLGIEGGASHVDLVRYVNLPQSIAVVVSSGHAKLHELQTIYGTRDLYDFLEIIAVDIENQRRLNARED